MAQLLLIAEAVYIPGTNEIGDIVGVFPDGHQFTVREQEIFQIVSIPNVTDTEFLSCLKSPEIQTIKDEAGNEYHMWRNDPADPWKKLVVEPKYTWTTAGVGEEAAAILLDPAIGKAAKLTLLQQFGNNTSYQDANRAVKYNLVIEEVAA